MGRIIGRAGEGGECEGKTEHEMQILDDGTFNVKQRVLQFKSNVI
jgi:hypothetical protein